MLTSWLAQLTALWTSVLSKTKDPLLSTSGFYTKTLSQISSRFWLMGSKLTWFHHSRSLSICCDAPLVEPCLLGKVWTCSSLSQTQSPLVEHARAVLVTPLTTLKTVLEPCPCPARMSLVPLSFAESACTENYQDSQVRVRTLLGLLSNA